MDDNADPPTNEPAAPANGIPAETIPLPARPIAAAPDDATLNAADPDDTWETATSVLATVAPLLAIASSGPLAALAISTITRALGLDPTVSRRQLTNQLQVISVEQLQALRLADRQFRLRMRALNIPLRCLGGEPPGPANPGLLYARFPAVFALVISLTFFLLLMVFAWHPIPEGANATVLNVMLGGVAASFTQVVSYFFGSTSNSGRKDVMLYNSIPNRITGSGRVEAH